MTLTLPGLPVPKKNSKQIFLNRRTGKPFVTSSERYKAWREEMGYRIRRFRPAKPFVKAKVAIRFFAENRRRFDLSNAAESVMDLLVEEGFLQDDCVENVPELVLSYAGVDREKPRAEIQINELTKLKDE